MNKFHGLGLVVLLAVTFALAESAYGSTTFTNNVGGDFDSSGLTEFQYSTADAINSRFTGISGESYFDNSTDTMHVVWFDDTTPNDIIFYSTTTDGGITHSTPLTIYTGGGGSFPQVESVQVFSSGNDVFVGWMLEETGSLHSFLEVYSADNGATFSTTWVAFANATGINAGLDREMVGNSLDDVILVYRNSTSDTLEARVSHNNGLSWTFETLAGDNHGSGNADGFHSFDDSSITISGNQIDLGFTADYTGGGGGCGGVDCNSVFHQQSTDAGDTWLTDPLLLNDGLDDHNNEPPFIFVSETGGSGVINIFYQNDEDPTQTGQFQHARSTNGGTSFSIELDTGLLSGGCGNFLQPFNEWIVIGADNQFAVFCDDLTNGIDFVSSSNGGSTWSSVGNISTLGNSPSNFQGFANSTLGMIVFELASSNEKHIAFSDGNGLATWYDQRDVFRDNESGNFDQNILVGFTDDRVILPMAETGGTDEVVEISFDLPVCITDPTFNCPFDLSLNSNTTDEPTSVAGVATTTGYHGLFQINGGGGNPRLYYATSPDAESGSTPLDISGVLLNANPNPNGGILQTDMHIFEDGAGTIDAFWIELDRDDFPPFNFRNEAFHARSTDGGTSFSTKLPIATVGTFGGVRSVLNIEPVVNGNDLSVLFHNSTLGFQTPFFVGSGDGGSTWGTPVNIEGDGVVCNIADANGNLRLVRKTTSPTGFYAMWHGINATSSSTGICFNLSTDGGATWGTTVQGLDDVNTSASPEQFFDLFVDGSDLTAIWTSNLADELHMARSTNSGVSFGAEEGLLDTVNGGSGASALDNALACTDPQVLGHAVQDGSNIYAFCQGGSGTRMIKSTDMGATLDPILLVSTTSMSNWNTIASDGLNVLLVGEDNDDKALVFHSIDSGATWDETNTLFPDFIRAEQPIFGYDVLTGNSTHAYVGFEHRTGFDSATNAYVTMGIFVPAIVVNNSPVVTILGDNPLQHLLDTTYTDAGATCSDFEDGDLTSSIVTVSTVNSAVLGDYTVTYTCTDSGSSVDEEIRNVSIVAEVTTTTTTGGGVGGGSPVGDAGTGVEGFSEAQQEAFDQAVQDAIESIDVSPTTPLEAIIQTFFEFQVIDKEHTELQLNSFLPDQRLGIRWSTGDDIVIVSATPAPSPFMFTFEAFPFVASGSGAFVSTNSLLYNLQIPNQLCTDVVVQSCVEKIRYEVPITVNAIINNTQVSDTGSIIVDLVEEAVDPIILIILATAGIPILAVIVQRARGRSASVPLRRVVSG